MSRPSAPVIEWWTAAVKFTHRLVGWRQKLRYTVGYGPGSRQGSGCRQLLELLRDSVEGNIDTIFSAIQHDIPIEEVAPPTAALEYARRLARHGVEPHALLRAYRLGQQKLLDIVLHEIRSLDWEREVSLEFVVGVTNATFGYIDGISQRVVEVYQQERERWLENRNSLRAMRVRELLDGGEVDVDTASATVGYPLRRTHLAVCVWTPDGSAGDNELDRLQRYVRGLAEALGAPGDSLFIALDRLTGCGWIPLPGDAATGAVAGVRRYAAEHPDGSHLALGDPLPGLDGFRRSYRQALRTRAVAVAAGASAPRVTAAADPGLSAAALLTGDLAEARTWVQEVLGPLSADTKNDARLRETLGVFLRHGSSYTAAADELNLHFNTVKYRVQRAVERRGRPIVPDRLDVELALLICQWFGAAVLRPQR